MKVNDWCIETINTERPEALAMLRSLERDGWEIVSVSCLGGSYFMKVVARKPKGRPR